MSDDPQGQKLVLVKLDRWTPGHPVANAIATGSYGFAAWMEQKAKPLGMLSKQTGIAAPRLLAIDAGDCVSIAELDALARAWAVGACILIASIGNAANIVSCGQCLLAKIALDQRVT